MTNAKLIISTFLIVPNVVVIQKDERITNVMWKLVIVTVVHVSQDKNVTNVNLDTLIFLIAKVSITITLVPGVPTSFRQEFSKKSLNVTKKRKKLVKVCLHSS